MKQPDEVAQPATQKPEKKVEVTVDQKSRKVRSGSYLVSEFKKEVKVDAALALDQVIEGGFKPLDDNETISIQGGEIFVSHVRQGGAS